MLPKNTGVAEVFFLQADFQDSLISPSTTTKKKKKTHKKHIKWKYSLLILFQCGIVETVGFEN